MAPVEKAVIFKDVLSKLNARFNLGGRVSPNLQLNQLVQLVSSVDDLLRKLSSVQYAVATGSTGHKTLLTVPAGKRYHVVNAIFNSPNTGNKIGGITIRTASGPIVYWDKFTTAEVVVYRMTLYSPLVLDGGDTLGAQCTTYISAGDFELDALIYIEDVG